jgi:hypothetical protein
LIRLFVKTDVPLRALLSLMVADPTTASCPTIWVSLPSPLVGVPSANVNVKLKPPKLLNAMINTEAAIR